MCIKVKFFLKINHNVFLKSSPEISTGMIDGNLCGRT